MNSVAGIFLSRAAALSAINRLRSIGIGDDLIILLSPGAPDEHVERTIPVTDTEAGTGEKIGSSVGRGAGIAGGIMLGGAVGSIFVPGVGAVVAAGVLTAALLSIEWCFLACDSRRKHKAWGTSPRCQKAGDSSKRLRLSPVLRARKNFFSDPGACAPGFMLTPAIAG